MEDRYLFKAKRIDNGEWKQGYLFDDGFENGRVFIGGIIIEKYNGTACDDWNVTGIDFCEVDPSTICQCTGLRDKNGKLIFENDIVNATDVHCVCVDGIVVKVTDYNLMLNLYYSYELERVGNIFDNKELLESE